MVPGVMPDRWARTWAQRHPGTALELVPVEDSDQLAVLRSGTVQMAFVRDVGEHDGLHLIPLYAELGVVVLPRDHPWAEATELALADLSEEHLLQDPAEVPGWAEIAAEVNDGTRLDLPTMTTRQAVEVVASGTGVVVVPMSVARLHHRRDVVAVPVVDLPQHPVGLAWPRGQEESDPRIEDFIGIVRGRTARSSRGKSEPATDASPARKQRDRAAPRPGRGRGGAGAPQRGGRRGGRRRG
jgi:DNA-binding transcriptional LysR family regulator